MKTGLGRDGGSSVEDSDIGVLGSVAPVEARLISARLWARRVGSRCIISVVFGRLDRARRYRAVCYNRGSVCIVVVVSDWREANKLRGCTGMFCLGEHPERAPNAHVRRRADPSSQVHPV